MRAAAAPAGTELADHWTPIRAKAPTMAATMAAYLDQIALSLRQTSVDAADYALRDLATYLVDHTKVLAVRGIRRGHIEGYKSWLGHRQVRGGKTISARTVRHRLGMLRTFFERLIEWDWADAPRSGLILSSDMPLVDEPLPRFLDDPAAAALIRAAANAAPFDRLVVELLARTGMRVGELCNLAADAVVQIGDGQWLRVPVGKLHNDRYVPLHPAVTTLVENWRAAHPAMTERLICHPGGRPLDRHVVTRALNRVARAAGIGHVSPHQLRHTLATQSINRGMSLEAIAALLGHRDLKMTLVYARIADRRVADEYFAVTQQVEALYTTDTPVLPATAEGAAMRRLRQELQRRDLGNGYCTRPANLACAFETVCETCVHFATGPEFVPVLVRQRNHAAKRDQTNLVNLYDGLLQSLGIRDEDRQGYAGEEPT